MNPPGRIRPMAMVLPRLCPFQGHLSLALCFLIAHDKSSRRIRERTTGAYTLLRCEVGANTSVKALDFKLFRLRPFC